MNGRNELYPDPFDEFDPHHTTRGKKAFNNDVRCLQSKIDLSNYTEKLPKRQKNKKVSIKQSVIDDFDKMYLDNCDNKAMNTKQRGVSVDNSFHISNKTPKDHLVPDKILEKPGRLTNLAQLKDSKPLAGRFSEIGEKIFEVG